MGAQSKTAAGHSELSNAGATLPLTASRCSESQFRKNSWLRQPKLEPSVYDDYPSLIGASRCPLPSRLTTGFGRKSAPVLRTASVSI